MSCSHPQRVHPHLSLAPSNCKGAERKALCRTRHDGSGRGAVLAPCAKKGIIIFFLSACAREGFFPHPVPSSYLLAPGTSTSEIRLLGAPAAGWMKELVRAESFLRGVLLGIMLVEHDARPLLKISSCVMVPSEGTIIFDCNYVPAKIIVPKNPYQVFLWYRLVKYQENTNQYRTKIPNRDTALVFSGVSPEKLCWCVCFAGGDFVKTHTSKHKTHHHPNQGTALRLYLPNYCVRYVGTDAVCTQQKNGLPLCEKLKKKAKKIT